MMTLTSIISIVMHNCDLCCNLLLFTICNYNLNLNVTVPPTITSTKNFEDDSIRRYSIHETLSEQEEIK
jgi:hypothetical protein